MTRVELEGRKIMVRILRFCRRQPGVGSFTIDHCCTECGVRETVTIEGQKEVSAEDYASGRVWDDSVCYSFYMLGIHRDDELVSRGIEPGVFPTIPYGPRTHTGIIPDLSTRCTMISSGP